MSTCDKLTGTLTLGATMSGGLLVAKGEKGDKGDKGDKGATGPQGPQGIQGPKGEGYTLTESDKTDISKLVINKLPYTIGVDSEGYIGVTYNGE